MGVVFDDGRVAARAGKLSFGNRLKWALGGPGRFSEFNNARMEDEMTSSFSPKRTDRQRVQYSHRLLIKMILCLTLSTSCARTAMAQGSQTGDQGQAAAEVSKEASNP